MSGGEGGVQPVAHYEASAARGPPSEAEEFQQMLQETEDEEYDESDEKSKDADESAGVAAGEAVKTETDEKK